MYFYSLVGVYLSQEMRQDQVFIQSFLGCMFINKNTSVRNAMYEIWNPILFIFAWKKEDKKCITSIKYDELNLCSQQFAAFCFGHWRATISVIYMHVNESIAALERLIITHNS